MKHISIILLAWISIYYQAGQDLYTCKNARINLYSKAPIEDIEGTSTSGTSVYDPVSGELVFSVAIRSFHFNKSKMEEHFNENYLESDKYPRAIFKGKVKEHIDVSQNGTFPVTVTGDLDVHGVKQPRTVSGSMAINNGVITMSSEFMVKCVDHNIPIPKIVFHNIAETIRIRVSATYSVNKNR